MKHGSRTYFDYIVIGASVSGNIFCQNINHDNFVLLIEKCSYGRNKPCSGIQFNYLERLLSLDIPDDVLCKNQISHVEFFVKGKRLRVKYNLLNFYRDRFDRFLTDQTLKLDNVIINHDECFTGFWQDGEFLIVETDKGKYRCRFLIDGSGLRSYIRKTEGKDHGGTLNSYYSVESSDLDKTTCYQFYDDRSDAMFSWVYFKDNMLVIGNGMKNISFANNARDFANDIINRFNVHGKLIKQEGYAAPLLPIKLSQNKVFFLGDAAGLISLERGVGIDIAIKSALNLARIMNDTNEAEMIEKLYFKSMEREILSSMKQNNGNMSMMKIFQRGVGLVINSIHNKFSMKYNYRLN